MKNFPEIRGSSSGRPIMILLDYLGKRWALRIMWELRNGPLTFRDLRENCDNISPTTLNARLKELKMLDLIHIGDKGYEHTRYGQELGIKMTDLDLWANKWAAS